MHGLASRPRGAACRRACRSPSGGPSFPGLQELEGPEGMKKAATAAMYEHSNQCECAPAGSPVGLHAALAPARLRWAACGVHMKSTWSLSAPASPMLTVSLTCGSLVLGSSSTAVDPCSLVHLLPCRPSHDGGAGAAPGGGGAQRAADGRPGGLAGRGAGDGGRHGGAGGRLPGAAQCGG